MAISRPDHGWLTAQRKPVKLLRLSGVNLLRAEARTRSAVSIQEPPRATRSVPAATPGGLTVGKR